MDALLSTQLELPIENGMFVVTDPARGDLAAIEDGLAEATDSGRFVAVVRDMVTVVTPAEDSAGTPILVQVWPGTPPADDFAAEHEVELDVTVSSGRLEIWLVGGPEAAVDGFPSGAYRLRVSGRGLTPFDQYDGVSRESYRLLFRPRTEPAPPVVLRRWPGWDQY